MLNLKHMQAKVDKMLSVFTKLKAELETQQDVLVEAMAENNKQMQELQEENGIYYRKIIEYSTLVSNIDKFLGKE